MLIPEAMGLLCTLYAVVQLEFGTWLGEMWERAATSFLPSVPRLTESAALFRSSPLGHRAPNRCVDRDYCRISVRGQSAALDEVNLVGVYSNHELRKNRCRPALHAYTLADEGTVCREPSAGRRHTDAFAAEPGGLVQNVWIA